MDLVKKLNPFKRRQLHHQLQQQNQLPAPLRQWERLRPTIDQQREAENKRKAAEKELLHLNNKIEKLLANLDDSQNETGRFPDDEECVVCLSAKATMKTLPCGHRVVCRTCFVKTIQTAVTERCFPLRCVVCRTKILKLKQSNAPAITRPHLPTSPPPTPAPRSLTPTTTSGLVASRAAPPALPKSGTIARSLLSCGGNRRTTSKSPDPPAQSLPPSNRHSATPPLPPTVTRLMHPLLIYPSTSGDKRPVQSSIGWSGGAGNRPGGGGGGGVQGGEVFGGGDKSLPCSIAFGYATPSAGTERTRHHGPSSAVHPARRSARTGAAGGGVGGVKAAKTAWSETDTNRYQSTGSSSSSSPGASDKKYHHHYHQQQQQPQLRCH